MWRSAIWVLALGCDSGAKEPAISKPADPAPRAAPVTPAGPVAPPGDAISEAQPLPDAAPRAVRPPTRGWLDTPAWPTAGGDLELAWLVGTDLVPRASSPDILESPLSLVVSIGGVSRQAVLLSQFGSLKSYNQSACAGINEHPAIQKLPRDLAQITFTEGGAGGYYVRRKGGDAIEIGTWEESDGACTVKGQIAACPRHETAAVRMHVPAKGKVHEAIFEVDAAGTRTPFDCKN